jgi:hypothetical protein
MTEPRRIEREGAAASVWRDAPSWDEARTAAVGEFSCANADRGALVLNEITAMLQAEGYAALIGPMDGDTWHGYRVVTESDGAPPFALEPVSGPQDFSAFQAAGFAPISEYVSARGNLQDAIGVVPASVQGVTVTAWNGRDADQLIDRLFTLSSAQFSRNRFYKSITREAFVELYQPILPMIDPGYVLFAHDVKGRLVGFLFGLPDWLETTDGETVIIKTYASTLRGVGHLLADTLHRRALSKGFKHVIHALMHVDNISRERSARYGARIFRGYALMGRRLVPT